MAMPPIKGMSSSCHFRPPGLSTNPIRIEIGLSNQIQKRVPKKAAKQVFIISMAIIAGEAARAPDLLGYHRTRITALLKEEFRLIYEFDLVTIRFSLFFI